MLRRCKSPSTRDDYNIRPTVVFRMTWEVKRCVVSLELLAPILRDTDKCMHLA